MAGGFWAFLAACIDMDELSTTTTTVAILAQEPGGATPRWGGARAAMWVGVA